MKQNNRLLVNLLLLLGIAAIIGCGSVRTVNAEPTSEQNTVVIQSFKFHPAEITIQKGEAVTWINQDSVGHTVTGAAFESGLLSKGQSFTQTFNETGTFDYKCLPHPGMRGKVIVQ